MIIIFPDFPDSISAFPTSASIDSEEPLTSLSDAAFESV